MNVLNKQNVLTPRLQRAAGEITLQANVFRIFKLRKRKKMNISSHNALKTNQTSDLFSDNIKRPSRINEPRCRLASITGRFELPGRIKAANILVKVWMSGIRVGKGFGSSSFSAAKAFESDPSSPSETLQIAFPGAAACLRGVLHKQERRAGRERRLWIHKLPEGDVCR